jgi:hypothetical protein
VISVRRATAVDMLVQQTKGERRWWRGCCDGGERRGRTK